ncbi:Holliday junction resolvase RusA-like endonuclease [Endobacter medicaginis]|uniref:Holliday junction resolvase RusA-like endonuclease n=1 Tax=Endobacter medicaginis TaxID=1181271 RepID=A0A839V5A6_9PROT|nr:RusA family crossover junction endodeoxyribonuclease [Endobacter medicaginis]MBB3175594.1 Holliday junction resolvase RusA-like endonuclease [Endobacter medicaginis]MCX5477270.1 RusA family crossover junction endodeoxyribonuclease [Endobacter medicaginis]NVN31135.1 RusA family crossover junction endodeoxyribonuclease [Endobacter medicaginis]
MASKRKFPPSRHSIPSPSNRFLEFVVVTRPIPKARPRLSRHGAYTPQRTLDYESLIQLAAQAAMASSQLPLFDEPVRVVLTLTFAGRDGTMPTAPGDGDADNLAKSVLDAMNGTVFADDRLVVSLTVNKTCGTTDGVRVRVETFAANTDINELFDAA